MADYDDVIVMNKIKISQLASAITFHNILCLTTKKMLPLPLTCAFTTYMYLFEHVAKLNQLAKKLASSLAISHKPCDSKNPNTELREDDSGCLCN